MGVVNVPCMGMPEKWVKGFAGECYLEYKYVQEFNLSRQTHSSNVFCGEF